MEAEVVRKRHWVTREQFLDLLGPVNLIPGPNSTEMAIHLWLDRAGWHGLIVAGVPGALLTTFGRLSGVSMKNPPCRWVPSIGGLCSKSGKTAEFMHPKAVRSPRTGVGSRPG